MKTNTISKRRVIEEISRTDLGAFVYRTFQTICPADRLRWNWHLDAICYHLDQCRERKIKRLLITLPPRHLKSICTSVAFPAYLLGRNPCAKIVCASYSRELAEKHARDCRVVMRSAWYGGLFPRTKIGSGKDTVHEIETSLQGYRLATSVEATLTGRGGNYLIVDDPLQQHDAMSAPHRAWLKKWWDGTLFTRLDDKQHDVIILVMHRLHEDDLANYVLEKGDWTHLNLPAIAETSELIPTGPERAYFRRAGETLHPDREPIEVIEKIRHELGSFVFSAQYQQSPVPAEGNFVKREWLKTYTEKDLPEDGYIVQSWDSASKVTQSSDFSVCTTWLVTESEYFLLNVFRERLDFPALCKAVNEQAGDWAANIVLIEDTSSGTALLQMLTDGPLAGGFGVQAVKPQGNKELRLSIESPAIENGFVYVPEEAPWLGMFLQELLGFPSVRHDDQVDSVSQFLQWAREASVESAAEAEICDKNTYRRMRRAEIDEEQDISHDDDSDDECEVTIGSTSPRPMTINELLMRLAS